MHCVVYRAEKKRDTYLFIEQEGDFARVPKQLLAMLGALEKVMSIDLAKRQKLAQADPVTVMTQLSQNGFYLQMPPPDR